MTKRLDPAEKRRRRLARLLDRMADRIEKYLATLTPVERAKRLRAVAEIVERYRGH